MTQPIATFLAQYPVVTLFGVIGIGYLLGQARIFGFRIGVAGVLFAGLAAGALGPEVARCEGVQVHATLNGAGRNSRWGSLAPRRGRISNFCGWGLVSNAEASL